MAMSELVTPTRADYGAVELKQSYRKYLGRGLYLAVILHVIGLEAYMLYTYYAPKDEPPRVVQLTKYVELQQLFKLKELPPAPVAIFEGAPPGGTEGAGASDAWPPGQEFVESIAASTAPKRMALAAELNDLNNLDIGTQVPVESKIAGRGVESKNTPEVATRGNSAGTSSVSARDGLSSLEN